MPFRKMYSVMLSIGFAFTLPLNGRADTVDLMVGNPSGRNVTFAFERDADRKPVALTIATHRLGNPGAKLSIWIDRSTTPLLSRILTADDCKYSDAGSTCRFSIDGTSEAYRQFLVSFEKGVTAHVEVENANVMEMQEDIPLDGFRKKYRL